MPACSWPCLPVFGGHKSNNKNLATQVQIIRTAPFHRRILSYLLVFTYVSSELSIHISHACRSSRSRQYRKLTKSPSKIRFNKMRLLDPNTDSESDGESTNQLPNASFASGGISCNTPGPQPLHSAINTIRKLHDPLNLPIHSRDVSLQYGGSSLMMQEQQPLSSIIHPTENFPRPLDPPPHPRPQQQALKDPQVLRGSVVFSQPSNLVFCDLPGFALCDNRTLSQVETIKAQTSGKLLPYKWI